MANKNISMKIILWMIGIIFSVGVIYGSLKFGVKLYGYRLSKVETINNIQDEKIGKLEKKQEGLNVIITYIREDTKEIKDDVKDIMKEVGKLSKY